MKRLRAVNRNQFGNQLFRQNGCHQVILSMDHYQRHFGFSLAFVSFDKLGLYKVSFAGIVRRFLHFGVGGGEITRFSGVQRLVAQAT